MWGFSGFELDIDSCIGSKSCQISSTGFVTCTLPCKHSAYCANIDLTDWPFDVQTCQFMLTSRKYDAKQLQFRDELLSITTNVKNELWDLLLTSWQITERTIPVALDNATHSFLLLNFQFQRHNQRFFCQIIVPALVLMICNVSLLLLSPEMPERIVLFVINLMSHKVFLTQLYWTWAWLCSDKVSLILKFFSLGFLRKQIQHQSLWFSLTTHAL